MFTGIVQSTATVTRAIRAPGLLDLTLQLPMTMTNQLTLGASVAVDGVCLTVTRIEHDEVSFQAIAETLSRTTLENLHKNHRVNVERSARVGDEIGGHLLSGHIDTTATICFINRPEDNWILGLKIDPRWIKYLLPKGYVALSGLSLTLVDVDPTAGIFTVHLIPETLARTTLSEKNTEDKLNVEIDRQTQAIVDTVENYLTRLNPLEAHP